VLEFSLGLQQPLRVQITLWLQWRCTLGPMKALALGGFGVTYPEGKVK